MYFDQGNRELFDDWHSASFDSTLTDVSPAQFASVCDQGRDTKDAMLYFTHQLNEPGLDNIHGRQLLDQYFPSWRGLVVRDAHNGSDIDPAPVASLWLGGAGATTQLHYDLSHNCFVQVYGRKRFSLFDPDKAHLAQLFPELHPRARKSQAPYSALQLGEPMEIVLEPGDVLYVPPFFLHHVKALDCSASFNVFSFSAEELLLRKQQRLPLPFESHWTAPEVQLALGVFIDALTRAVAGADARQFIQKHIVPRYSSTQSPDATTKFSICDALIAVGRMESWGHHKSITRGSARCEPWHHRRNCPLACFSCFSSFCLSQPDCFFALSLGCG
eukprot:m.147537 g.147537  ORF g.147537 m.147537 type:complete len:330 (-) comp17289_c0_seq3:340-1329(-)